MKDNLVGFLALFVALGGTGAYAANTIGSTDIVDGEVKSADVKDQSLTTFDVSTFLGADVVDNTLTGDDINESTLVGLEDVCPPTMALYLPVCARSDGVSRNWLNALFFCRDLGLRLPSLGEAIALGFNYDVPGVADEGFWTDEAASQAGSTYLGFDDGQATTDSTSAAHKTVCVTTPSSLYQ